MIAAEGSPDNLPEASGFVPLSQEGYFVKSSVEERETLEPPSSLRESRFESVRGEGAPVTGVKLTSGAVCCSWLEMAFGKYFSCVSSQTTGA